jgi:putative ABC transport system permease protein
MKFLRSVYFKAAMDTVRRSKGRSFWTMVGIIIGVTSVISIVAIGEGIKQQVGVQLHQFGPNVITVRTAQLSTQSGGSTSSSFEALGGFSVTSPLTLNDINVVSRVKGVNASAPLTLVDGSVTGDYGSYNKGVVIGTSSQLPSLFNQSLEYGAFFNSSQMGSNVAVLGENIADKIFNEDVPLGRTFTFHNQQFIVVGIFNEFPSAPLSQQADFNDAVFIPNQIAEQLTNKTAPTYEIMARASNKKDVSSVAKKIKSALDTAHGGSSGFSVLTGNQNLVVNNNILDLLTHLIAGVAGISLLVAGIGIMNVMLVSVAERVREIGIKKAVGATNRQILNQFVMEAVLISFIGGLIGIALSYLIDLILRLLTSLRPDITWQIVIIAAGVSLFEGIFFGSIPAIKAARKDPIDALRAE